MSVVFGTFYQHLVGDWLLFAAAVVLVFGASVSYLYADRYRMSKVVVGTPAPEAADQLTPAPEAADQLTPARFVWMDMYKAGRRYNAAEKLRAFGVSVVTTDDIVPEQLRVEHIDGVRHWDEWIACVNRTVDVIGDRESVDGARTVLAGFAPASMFVLLGMRMPELGTDDCGVSVVNPAGRVSQYWSLDEDDIATGATPETAILMNNTVTVSDQGGLLMMLFTLNPSYSIGIENLARTLQTDIGETIIGTTVIAPDGSAARMVEPSDAGQLYYDMGRALRSQLELTPNCTGLVVASALPQPLNLLLGRLLVRIAPDLPITLVEKVGHPYRVVCTVHPE